MSTITATNSTSTAGLRPFRRASAITISAALVVVAAIALTVWLLVRSPATHAHVTHQPVTTVQQVGAGQGNGFRCPPEPHSVC